MHPGLQKLGESIARSFQSILYTQFPPAVVKVSSPVAVIAYIELT